MTEDIVVDGVPIGPTEIATFLTMLAAISTLIFHKDWGITAHAQTLATQALILLPIALGVLRSFKHHLNTKVAIAKIAALPASPAPAPGVAVVTSNTPSTSTVTVIGGGSGNLGTGQGGAGGVGGTASSAARPDPTLGVGIAPVDVTAIPEDITP